MSSTEDSALGSCSTGPSYSSSTDKSSSILDNGVSTELSADTVTIKMVTLQTPSPRCYAPRSPSPARRIKIANEVSTSSGVGDNALDEEDEPTSRSATPTSQCSSAARSPRDFRRPRRKKRKERLPSVLSHVASVFRKGSRMKHSMSPRRISSMIPAVPGKMTPKDKKLLKMILVIFAAFVVCYLPITVSKILRDRFDSRPLNIAGYILIYLTTCINPIIYVVMSSEYRQAYKNLIMCRSADSQLPPAPARAAHRA